ncbi:alcohol dehydrogenase catalytic domain-containing protein [Acetobacterium paludosum]|uniref:Alcohol dehydrogenase catalytic domain-containing protein n=1 Tax=Acetobacterium paludosum TaxID=52693 RepID=A0A923I576_9FIRM|nr:alcohol dehydrogenase catalytic domain-containing protein [Acetobacterium paludosum]MBC3889230.1 alcohol dehydrogenase catalytic domain-containing protein [Acetobacterium paludosum]
MKAAVLEKAGKLEINDLEMPVCGDDEILVKIKVCNIGKMDIRCATLGQRDLVYPRVLGREIAGIITQKGKEAVGYQVGQRVHVHPKIVCGKCEYCKERSDNLCDQVQIMGFNLDGGFQEFLRIPSEGVKGKILNVIDNDDLNFGEISFIEPLACCVNIQDSLKLKPSSVMVIIGGGRMGVLNLLVAKASGIKKVLLIEKNEERRKSGLELGFDEVFGEKQEDIIEQIKAVTKDQGADVVIPCCPGPNALNLAMKILRKKGQLGYFSGVINEEGVQPDINLIHYKEISVIGTYGSSRAHSRKAKALLESGKINVKPLISHYVSLDDLALGMEYVKNCDGYSTIVKI